MFEHIVLRRAEHGLPISVGQIAEALLYYQKVHLFLDRGTLRGLIECLGPAATLQLLRRPEVTAVYCEENLGTHTSSVGVTQFHGYVAFFLSGDQKSGQLKTLEARLRYEVQSLGISKKEAERFVRDFLTRIPARKLSGDHFIKGGIVKAAQEDLSDTEYMRRAIRSATSVVPGGYEPGDALAVEIIQTDQGAVVLTDLDFEAINRRRASLAPPQEAIGIAHLLSSVLDARADLAIASFYGGEFATSRATSSIIQVRYSELLVRGKLNAASRQQFTEVILPDSPRLAEVIDSGERSFDEFVSLLDKADRFKDWLGSVNPDEGLVRTYLRDVSSKGWIERLPAKSLRYVLTMGLEKVNPVAGVVAGLVDNFLIEKLLSGWRPNHFVSRDLGPFVLKNTTDNH
jgi:hypothetical protein